MLGFFKAVFSMPGPIVVWVMFLFSVNLIPALIFIETLEARVVLGGLVAGAILQTWIFSKKGFVRLLGLGHVLWLPMVVWLGYRTLFLCLRSHRRPWKSLCLRSHRQRESRHRVPLADPGSLFAYVNSLSLAIDTIDVIRYVRGNRKPTLSA